MRYIGKNLKFGRIIIGGIDEKIKCWCTYYLEDGTSCYCVVDLYTGLLALEQQLYRFDDEFEFIYTNMINAK